MRRLFLLLALITQTHSATANTLDLDQFKGKVVYVDFWASWCGPCRQSFPWMQAMQQKYGAKGFQVVAINLDQEPELAKKFLEKYAVDFKVEYDAQGEIAQHFGVQAMPTSLLIDRTGKTRERHNGYFSDKQTGYESEILALLGE